MSDISNNHNLTIRYIVDPEPGVLVLGVLDELGQSVAHATEAASKLIQGLYRIYGNFVGEDEFLHFLALFFGSANLLALGSGPIDVL